MTQPFRKLPDLATDVPLFPLGDVFSVIMPLARRNLVTNPSFETGTTGWSATTGATLTRVSTQQVAGAWSLQVAVTTGGKGTYYPITLAAGTTYAWSASILAPPGTAWQLQIVSSGGTIVYTRRSGTGTGRWQRASLVYTATSTTTYRLTCTCETDSQTIWIDAAQLEVCESGNWFATTYIDGDRRGLVANQSPAPFGWDGTPHASTSYRLATTRAGGYSVPFSQLGLIIVALLGLGMAPVQVQALHYAQIDGGQYMRTHKSGREFTIAARLNAPTVEQVQRLRSALSTTMDRDANALDQPLVLRYQPANACGDPTGAAVLIPCAYTGGLEGGATARNGADLNLSFSAYMPLVQAERESGVVLTAAQNTSAGYTNNILQRDITGLWKAVAIGVTGGIIRTIVPAPDGSIYIGGDFTFVGGVGSTRGIARYDPISNTFSALGSGVSGGNVYSMAFDQNGQNLFVGGTFTQAGGVANTRFIARWNIPGGTWNAMGSGTSGGTSVAAVAAVGTAVVIGGSFSSPGTNFAIWNTSGGAWTAGTTGGGGIYALLYDPRGVLYLGGTFTSVNGQSAQSVAALTLSGTITPLNLGGTVRNAGAGRRRHALCGRCVYDRRRRVQRGRVERHGLAQSWHRHE